MLELGHIAKKCPEPKVERTDLVKVTCVNCGLDGHRARDCDQQRPDPFKCRNCGSSDHKAKDCPEPRSAENVECKNCSQSLCGP